MMCGGTSAPKEANADVQDLCDLMKGEAMKKTDKNFAEFTAVQFTTQVVAGTNYFVKVHIGSEEYVHIRVFRPLPNQGEPSLHSIQTNKSKEDALEYF